MNGTDSNKIKPNWIVYYEITKYEWDCPLCAYTNLHTESPEYKKTIRCFKCGSFFDKIRNGGYLEKG